MAELTNNQIERQFDRAAHSYDEVAGLQQKMAERMIDSLVQNIAASPESFAPASLVDIGCGTGYALEQLSQIEACKDWSFSGLDLSSEMLRVARKRLAQSSNASATANTIWTHADLQRTGLTGNQFDIAFSNAAIQWCDLQTAAEELFRILKPNGRLFLSTFADQTLSQWQAAFSQVEPGQPSRIHPFNRLDEIQTAFENAGFQIDQAQREQVELSYPSIDEMFASIKKLGATNAQQARSRGMLGKEKYQRFREHFQQQLEEHGQLPVTFDCVFIVGQKLA